MSNFKRTLSALLAVLMVFTMMTVAFTTISFAAPTVQRTASTNPSATFTVPQYIEAYGTNYYERGTHAKASGTIYLQVPGASNVNLSCSEPGISFSGGTMGTNNDFSWDVTGGDFQSAPTSDTTVKWTASYKVNGKTYTTYAWSAVKLVYNDPGFHVNVHHKNKWATHRSQNQNVQKIGPAYGNYNGSSTFNCYVDTDSGQYVTCAAPAAAAYNWVKSENGVGDSQDWTCEVTAVGNIYVDASVMSGKTLADIDLHATVTKGSDFDEDDSHKLELNGGYLTSATLNGTAVSGYSITTDSGKLNNLTPRTMPINGNIPAAGSTLKLGFQIQVEGNLTGTAVKSHMISYNNYMITLYSYDKSVLRTALAAATSGNYQQAQFLTAAPAGIQNAGSFRTWAQYVAALEQAWYVYGREDITQSEINTAASELNACLPVYDANANWQSGMMYGPADYSACDTLLAMIPTDFNQAYADNTKGKLYKYSYVTPLIDAIDDIAYDRPLDSRYQGTVDTMKQNLAAAIANITGQYKSVSLHFVGNGTDVANVPADTTATLFGTAAKPATDPTRTNYRFNGWYYDAACTQPVTWPISVDPSNANFQGDLTAKSDSAGVAYVLYAGWTLTGKQLNFETLGGSAISPVIGTMGQAYAGPSETPTRAGYDFAGWYFDNACQNAVDWSVFKFGDCDTVYAKWTPAPFTVTFNANGGTFEGGASTTAVTDLYGTPVAAPQKAPTKAGNGFVCWCYDAQGNNPIDFTQFSIPSSNITVYAKWNDQIRNVTYVYNNGTANSTITVEIGHSVNEPTQPARAGYSFGGWYKNEALTTAATFPFTMSGDNVTLYAKWNPLPFTVSFSVGEGASMPAGFDATAYTNLPCGSALTAPGTPTKKGFVFAGWTLEGAAFPFDENTVVPARNITLVAAWDVEPFTVTYRLSTDKTGTLQQGDIVTATVSMTANHIVSTHSFVVYYDKRYFQPALNGAPLTTAVVGTDACSKTAGEAYFTVLDNGGANVTDCSDNILGRVNSCTTAPQQFYPADWFVTGTTTLKPEYANYEYVYYIAADSPNGTRCQPDPEQDIASFQFMVLDNAPTADGTNAYAQLLMPEAFTKDADAKYGKITACRETKAAYDTASYWDSLYVLVDNDARFAVEPMVTSTISFDTNGGAALSAITDKQGRAIQLPTPNYAYHTFLGWTLTADAADTDYVDASAFVVPTSDITLHAKWQAMEVDYFVRHYKQNTTATGWLPYEEETKQAAVGTRVDAVAKEYVGFTCSNTDFADEVSSDPESPTILNLYYTRNSVQLSLDANGGTFVNGQTTATLNGLFDAAIDNVYGEPSRTGYTFNGWKIGDTAFAMDKYPATGATVRADWTANSYTINFYLDGTLYDSITETFGTPITAPTVTVESGMAFSGWKNTAGEAFAYTTMPAKTENFYGTTGIDGFYLTLMVDGAQYGEQIPVLNGTTVTADMVAYTPAQGYTFSGWKQTNGVTGAAVSFPMTLTADTTIYGFTTHEQYTITMNWYVDGELEFFDEVSGYYGDDLVLPEVPEEEYAEYGYGFNGWYTDADLTQSYTPTAKFEAQNIELYGEWYLLEGTVKFDLNGGNGTAPADMSDVIGATIVLPDGTGLSKQYYTFGGWGETSTSTIPVTSYDVVDTSVKTFYAIWNVNYAMVSFNLNGAEAGTTPETQKIEVGNSAVLPTGEDFVRDGFMFLGWATSAAATEALDAYEVTSTGNKTLYAVWAPLSVELVAREGSTTVIDNERGFIYGLYVGPDEATLNAEYLEVIGNGHLVYEYGSFIGTGTVVKLINDYTGNVDATYQIVIFGDVNGDGIVNSGDVSLLSTVATRAYSFEAGSAEAFAADVVADGTINTSDLTIEKAISVKGVGYDQANRSAISK